MIHEKRAELRRITREERAEMRRAARESMQEVLSWKRAVSAEMNARTFEEQLAHHAKMAEKYRAEGFNVVSRQ
jgi:hypothetical protein